jgi:hypothetical protein
VRVRTRQLLDGEIAKVIDGNKKAATQVQTVLVASTAKCDSNMHFSSLMFRTNVSLFHRCIYCVLCCFSARYRKQTEATAQRYFQFLSIDVKKFLPNIIDPLVDLCDDLFEFNPKIERPITLRLSAGGKCVRI